jgi:hypothetical protein
MLQLDGLFHFEPVTFVAKRNPNKFFLFHICLVCSMGIIHNVIKYVADFNLYFSAIIPELSRTTRTRFDER